MYKNLYEIGTVHASTDDQKYSCSSLTESNPQNNSKFQCPSLPTPNTNKFNPYYPNAPIPWYNREYYQGPELPYNKRPFFPSVSNEIPQVVQSYMEGGPNLPPLIEPEDPNSTNFYARELFNVNSANVNSNQMCKKPSTIPSYSKGPESMGPYAHPVHSQPPSFISHSSVHPKPPTHLQHSTSQAPSSIPSYRNDIVKNPKSPIPGQNDSLLPVLDCRFNLREICKQSILLEDHLSHDKKRCYDCCIKHFLAIEGLSEEAVTLDKDSTYKNLLADIPNKVRAIQEFWYTNPEQNSHKCSQMLREIRKDFQQKVFNIIFDDSSVEGDGAVGGSCSGGTCKIKQTM
jgi:hypothetical protein